MKMQTSIMIFFGGACIVLAIVIMILASTYAIKLKGLERTNQHIEQLESDLKTLLEEKRDLITKNDELYSDNIKLSDAVKELREINKKLTAIKPEAPVMKSKPNSLLPDGIATNMFMCEPYNKFAVNSQQAMLQEDCFTDTETGIRYYLHDGKRYFCAAMATAYGIEIGRTFHVRLECGTEFDVILADFKHPINNGRADDYGDICVNYDNQDAICIFEFVVDMKCLRKAVKEAGTMSAMLYFGGLFGTGGNVVEITYTERKWKP